MLKLVYSDFVKQDLKDISDFISQDNPFYATKVVNYLISSLEVLIVFPFLGKERKGLFREIVEPKYGFRVFYKVDTMNELIYIISIFKYKNNQK